MSSAQTVLTFPPQLPDHIEELLKPYFTYTQDQQYTQTDKAKDTSLYRKLFEFDHGPTSPAGHDSIQSSPALSTGLSPIQLSPINALDRSLGLPYDMPDCNLSPICRKSPKESRSACRLNFSGKMSMSVDASIVPDIANQMSSQSVFVGKYSK
ncbi:hypothetical protein NQ314_004043 [Rhamnusium bicolor]|uniref:Uncharacterized protein n=1 Tax=Rhamnusium bicolor TaxID=1586634 RepID=A0AAV8ZM55_9CUCU|nr:hypothetical protein NQ314_004043 [Rhamnusium bicolor]